MRWPAERSGTPQSRTSASPVGICQIAGDHTDRTGLGCWSWLKSSNFRRRKHPAPRFGQSDDSSTAINSSGSAVGHREQRYRLQSEDVLAIAFPLSPEFDQTVTVQPDGYISLLGAEDLQVQGLTIPGLVDALQKAYGNVLNHPIINVTPQGFSNAVFSSYLAKSQKPGQFALRYQTTVFEAIALAGGLTPAGKSHIFLLRRSAAGWFKVTPLSLSDIVAGKRVEDALLQPGDMVYVPEKFITKFQDLCTVFVWLLYESAARLSKCAGFRGICPQRVDRCSRQAHIQETQTIPATTHCGTGSQWFSGSAA